MCQKIILMTPPRRLPLAGLRLFPLRPRFHPPHPCIFTMTHRLAPPPRLDSPAFHFLGSIHREYPRIQVTRRGTLR
uniref:Uncharacterized protein n=1 Tax=Rhizophora mucronata TaxID=61149 RepID=A0A2P2NSJ2_RHIMU